jgi:hypothetical protein
MPAQCSEDWNGRGLNQAANGQWQATRIWQVIDAANEADALAAAPFPGSDLIPALNASHPQNARLIVTNRNPVTDGGPTTWKVTVSYSIVAITGGGGDGDPLNTTPIVSWGMGEITLAVDRDVDNKAIINSAGDAFDPPLQRTFKTLRLRIVKWFPIFDLALSDTFTNTVNSNNFQTGNLAITVGQCLCTGILPAEDYPITSTAIPIGFDFEIIRGLYNNQFPVKPYSTYVKDQGRRGWYTPAGGSTPTLGDFHYADGERVDQDVPLDGTGKPIDTTIRVTKSLIAPANNPTPTTNTLAPFSTAAAKWFEFKLIREANFSGLPL